MPDVAHLRLLTMDWIYGEIVRPCDIAKGTDIVNPL
jgi:hypothetical protein